MEKSPMMYKPGDKVIVKNTLSMDKRYPMLSGPNRDYAHYFVNDSMEHQRGIVFTIKEAEDNGWGYRLKEFGFGWTDSMFESVCDNECVCQSLL